MATRALFLLYFGPCLGGSGQVRALAWSNVGLCMDMRMSSGFLWHSSAGALYRC